MYQYSEMRNELIFLAYVLTYLSNLLLINIINHTYKDRIIDCLRDASCPFIVTTFITAWVFVIITDIVYDKVNC